MRQSNSFRDLGREVTSKAALGLKVMVEQCPHCKTLKVVARKRGGPKPGWKKAKAVKAKRPYHRKPKEGVTLESALQQLS